MNAELAAFARQCIKRDLAQCTDRQQHVFKLMYSPRAVERPINDVVDAMPDEKLDWAMTQTANSKKLNELRANDTNLA